MTSKVFIFFEDSLVLRDEVIGIDYELQILQPENFKKIHLTGRRLTV